jgi:hypothetical protein
MFCKQFVETRAPVDVFGRTTSGLHRSALGRERVGDLGHAGREYLGHFVADISGECRAGAVSADRCCHSARSGDRWEDELAISWLIGRVGPDASRTCGVRDRSVCHQVAGGSHDEPLMLEMSINERGSDHLATGSGDPFNIDVLTDVSTDEPDDCPGIEEAVGLPPSDTASSDNEHGDPVQIEKHRVRKSAAVGLHAVILRHTIQ